MSLIGFEDTDFSSGGNPFEAAVNYANSVGEIVSSEIDASRDAAVAALEAANTVIGQLGAYTPPPLPVPLEPPTLDFSFNGDFDLPPVNASSFGSVIAPNFGSAPGVSIRGITVPTIPDFVPTVQNITVPPPPVLVLPDVPTDAPEAPTLSFPDRPEFGVLVPPQLVDITIPTLDLPDLPDYNPEVPVFNEPVPPTGINWSEPGYVERIIDEVEAKLQEWLGPNNGTGLTPIVEQNIFDRGAEREDQISRQAVSEATQEFASRGYTLPPGVMLKRLDAIRAERDLKKQGLNRELVIEALNIEIQNIRFAIEQGINTERLFIELHQAAMQRAFEVARLTVEWQIQLYQISVEIYRARVEQVRLETEVYRARVDAWIAEISAYEALVRAEQAKADVNRALVDSYSAQIDARVSLINAYATEIEAEKVRIDAYVAEVQAYGEEVDAYSARVNAERTKADIYNSQITAEVSKAGIIEAESRAYAAEVSGITAGVQAQEAAVQADAARARALLDGYVAQVQGAVATTQASVSAIEAAVAAYQGDTSRFVAQANAEEARNRAETAAWEAGLRGQLEFYSTQVQRWSVELEGIVRSTEISLEALRAAGQYSSTIAAGALAALNVSASISGNGGLSASGNLGESYNRSDSCTTSQGVSYSLAGELEGNPPDLPCS